MAEAKNKKVKMADIVSIKKGVVLLPEKEKIAKRKIAKNKDVKKDKIEIDKILGEKIIREECPVLIEELAKKEKEKEKKLEKMMEQFEKEETHHFKEEEKITKKSNKKIKFRIILIAFLILIFSGAVVYAAAEFLPKAKIKIITEKKDFSFIDSIVAGKNVTAINADQKQIPAEVFKEKKNFTFSFLASAKKNVEQKASGIITIYNAYSSASQKLVANTRFSAPDGKIFRLNEAVVVPGAKIVDGKIISSSIEVKVIADKAGEEYNISPVNRFNIPGFQGTDKYKGFYAESKEAMKGGFIGESAYPTDEDIKKGKEQAQQQLKDNVDSYLSLQIPSDFKIIEGAEQFNISKVEVNTAVDEKNNFSIYVEAESVIIAFKESDLAEVVRILAKTSPQVGEDFEMKNYAIEEYGVARANFDQGNMSFAVDFKGNFEPQINIDEFQQQAIGKNEEELRELVFSMPHIEKAAVSLWPRWVNKAPDDIDRIQMEIE